MFKSSVSFAILLLVGSFLTAETTTPSVSSRVGFFWEQPLEVPVNADLTAAGLSSVDPKGLWSYGAASGFRMGDVQWEIASRRFSNFLIGSPEGSLRTRLAGDITDLIGGGRWNLGTNFTLNAGVGLNVAKYQLQTYGTGATTWTGALGQTNQATVVSSWNWGALATARLGWRPFGNDTTSLVLAAGASVAWSPFPVTWKLNDDKVLSGPSAPWTLIWTPALWFGLE